MPYTGGVGGCDEGQYPNGASNQADPTINVTSHEHNEAITDPQLNAWYDAAGYENGDKCAWDFGPLIGSAPAPARRSSSSTSRFARGSGSGRSLSVLSSPSSLRP